MGCDSAKEKIESQMLYLKLERVSVREERKKILDELEKITGLKWKRYEIPDYMNINERIKIENEILGINRSLVDEEEYYENQRKRREKNKKSKKRVKKINNKKNIVEEIKDDDSIKSEKKIEENNIKDIEEIDVEDELKKKMNEYNINEKNIQIKAIEIINKKHLKKFDNNDDNYEQDLNYIMDTINKYIENNKETKEKSEDNIVNNNSELIKIKPLKKNLNNNGTNNKKISSWIDNTYKNKKLLNFNKDFINMNEIKNNDENIN